MNDFQVKMIRGFMASFLKSASDEDLLRFVDQEVLGRLTPVQVAKLGRLVAERVSNGR